MNDDKAASAPAEPSAPTSSAETPKKPSSKIAIILIAAILVLCVAGIVLALIFGNHAADNPPAPQPEPVEPVNPTPTPTSFIIEGDAFLTVDNHQTVRDLSESFVAQSWDDVTNYFAPAVAAYANEEYQTPDVEADLAKVKDQFDFSKGAYAIVRHSDGGCSYSIMNVGITSIEALTAKVLFEIDDHCGLCAESYTYYAFPLGEYTITEIETETKVIKTETCDPDVVYKPVIYLYPTTTTNVSVKLGAPEKLQVSYPSYDGGWRVQAQPNGTLTDLKTGRQLYSLYYEADKTTYSTINDHGFIVKGSDTASFLEQKLDQLGLTEREAEEFIIYWLPLLQNNSYNYIYFALAAETTQNMPLNVSPQPDTVIRFTMEYCPLQAPLQLPEQQLPPKPERKGFTLVEWGGTLLHPNYN